MKSKSKFFSRKNRKKQPLLAKNPDVRPSYYEAMENEPNSDSRDEDNAKSNVKSSVPFQIARVVPEKTESSGEMKGTKVTASTQEDMSVFDIDFPAKVSFQEDDWDHEVLSPPNKKKDEKESNQNSKEEDIEMTKKPLISFPSSDGDDIFDDLESVLGGLEEGDDKFLNDFLRDGSIADAKGKPNFQSPDAEKANQNKLSQINFDNPSGNHMNNFTSPISSAPINTRSKGILIVDPNKNGAVYHMDEDNKSLTDKDLIIFGHQGGEDKDDHEDDATIMSNLTEVTYQKSKEERVKLIVQHLKDATTIPETNPFCSIFHCADLYPSSEDIKDALENPEEAREEAGDVLMKEAMATTEQQFKLTEDTGALIQSLFGGKVNYGSFNEKIIVCITRIYLALVEGGNDNGLRCTYNEPKLSHDLGVRLLEGNDGQAIVATVIPESTAERSGVQIGDKLSVSENQMRSFTKSLIIITISYS